MSAFVEQMFLDNLRAMIRSPVMCLLFQSMMDKSDTFFTSKIERLVEGLPGTEFAPSYVFHANRSASGGNQAWVHEAKIRHQKQHQKKQENSRKVTNQGNAKAKVEEERVSTVIVSGLCAFVLLCLFHRSKLTVVVLPSGIETKTSGSCRGGQKTTQTRRG